MASGECSHEPSSPFTSIPVSPIYVVFDDYDDSRVYLTGDVLPQTDGDDLVV